jgi:hypothetical protein
LLVQHREQSRKNETFHHPRKPLISAPLSHGQGPPHRHRDANADGVLDGDIDPFIEAYLMQADEPATA